MSTKQLRLLGVLLEELGVPQSAGMSTMEAVAALVAVENHLATGSCPRCHCPLSASEKSVDVAHAPFPSQPFGYVSMN
jgi:hypothetical protein